MNNVRRGSVLAACAIALMGAFAAMPAKAQFAAAIQAQTLARTPMCNENPDYPIIGRVVAYYNTDPRAVRMSFVGCFPNFASCEAWRREAMRPLNPPIVANRCEERF